MKYEIPTPLLQEHEALLARLLSATRAGGSIGRAANALAGLMDPHLAKENRFALPPLALLPVLARGEYTAEMTGVLELTDRLEADLPVMLEEHQRIFGLLKELLAAGEMEGDTTIIEFAGHLMHHAAIEEAVMYPAALLVGRLVRERAGH